MADDHLLHINLVTPERVLLDGTATEVFLRTAVGDLAFLPGHTPLVGTIEPGVVRVVREDGEVARVAAHGGFVQVDQRPADDGSDTPAGTVVTMLVGVAELAEEIDVERARVAREAAESRVGDLGGGAGGRSAATPPAEGEVVDPELVEAEAELRRAEVRLEAADADASASA
jgi:F-type H+-transporting ATPase subunit epsilon